jgi:hypothetical protein
MLAAAVVALLVAAALSQRSGGVTRSKIEDAVAPTFANLVDVQVSRLGAPRVEAASLHAYAQCQKVGATREAHGAGDWTCSIGWYVRGQMTGPVHDKYDLSVTSDGCYTATADGTEAHVGGPTVTARDGSTVGNLLYAFDGCFDVTAPVTTR